MEVKHIYWIAGFLDGEGCFKYNGTPIIQVSQTDLDLVEKFESIVKSGLAIREHDPRKHNHNKFYTLAFFGIKAVGWMMTLYPLMSKRRQAVIREIINQWKQVVIRQNGQSGCVNGHPMEIYGKQFYLHDNGSKICIACHKKRSHENYLKRKSARLNNSTEIIAVNKEI